MVQEEETKTAEQANSQHPCDECKNKCTGDEIDTCVAYEQYLQKLLGIKKKNGR